MRFAHSSVAAAAITLVACSAPSAVLMTPPPTSSPPKGQPFQATGGVSFDAQGVGATVEYGPWGVTGPGVELVYAGGGQWAGHLDGTEVRISTTWGRIYGPGLDVLVNRSGRDLVIRGAWFGKAVDFTIGIDRLAGSPDGGACSLNFSAAGPGLLAGELGCGAAGGAKASVSRGSLRLAGEAAMIPDVLMPQFVLALLSALPH
ncbi:MAG TPA: hypothetical protein VMT17_13970 [Anaeromyxobacteraceae bacterium]|nr:hypothetical protein [Anaeromyxobacteraceae bacterium]